MPNAGFVERETPHGKSASPCRETRLRKGLCGGNKGKRQNETVQRYSPCRRLPVGFAEVKSSDFHRRERLRPRWEGLRGAIRFDSLSRQRQRVFPTADLFIGTALPVSKQRHLIRLADARHLPLSGEGLRGAIRFVLCPGKGSVFFRLPTFLLHLHSLSRSKDTSSVSAYADPPSCLNCPLRGRSGYRPLSGEGLQNVMRFAYSSPPRIPLRPLPTAHSFARVPLRLFLAAPRPVLTTDHEPLFTVRYFIARAAFEC